MEAKPSAPDVAGTNGTEGRTLAGKRSSVAGARVGAHKETDTHEDWSSLAAADPALWLKEVD